MQHETILKKLWKSVCTDLDINPDAAKEKCRKGELVLARHIFCFWADDSEIFSPELIASVINCDRTSVFASVKKINKKYREGDRKIILAISKTAENAEKLLDKYSQPTNDYRVMRLLNILSMVDASTLNENTRNRAKNVLKQIIKSDELIKNLTDEKYKKTA